MTNQHNQNPWGDEEKENEEKVTAENHAVLAEENRPMVNLPNIIIFLLVVFTLIHLVRSYLTMEQDNWWILFASFIPARFTLADLDPVPGGQFALIYSWVSYSFLHGDWMHILFNSLWLVVFGSAVARRLSTERFIIFFILTSFSGALLFMLMNWGEVIPMIGASAVVSGLMGAVIRFMFSPVDKDLPPSDDWISNTKLLSLSETFRNKNAVLLIIVVLLMNYLEGAGIISLSGGSAPIAWEAHIGGFIAGLLSYGFFEKNDFSHQED